MTVRNGEFAAQYIDGGEVSDDHIQPNGVELSVGKLETIDGVPRVKEGEYNKGVRTPVQPYDDDYAVLTNGAYVVTYNEKIEIPEGYVGYVFPRSRLTRCGGFLTTALWDSGYIGKGEGLLMAQTKMKVELGMKIAQIVFLDAEDPEVMYDGSHQHENL